MIIQFFGFFNFGRIFGVREVLVYDYFLVGIFALIS